MWDIVWVAPQVHRSVSVSRHFLLQAPQCPCSMRKRFGRDHCCRGRSKPGCWIVGSHTRWEQTTWELLTCTKLNLDKVKPGSGRLLRHPATKESRPILQLPGPTRAGSQLLRPTSAGSQGLRESCWNSVSYFTLPNRQCQSTDQC